MERERRHQYTAWDVNEMMLPRQQRRDSDQHKPRTRENTQYAACVSSIHVGHNDSQDDVQRWEQIVGVLQQKRHTRRLLNEIAEQSRFLWTFWPGQSQRQHQETRRGHRIRKENASCEDADLLFIAAQKRCPEEQQIHRHIRDYHPRHERNAEFPVEVPRCDLCGRTLGGKPGDVAVEDQEYHRQQH